MSRALIPAALALVALTGCNDAPTTLKVRIDPEATTSADDLTAQILSPSRDAQADPIEYQFAWSVDGEARTDITGPTVPADVTSKGQVWSVTVTPTDGKKDGEAATAEVVVANTPPVAEIGAALTEVRSTEPLEVTGSATDADGDEVEMQWYWTRDGEGTPFDGPRVPAAFTYPGEQWVAHAVGFDGEDRGEAATIEILVLNSAPVIDDLVVTPEEPYTDTDLVAEVTATDADAQPITLTYTWTVDGRTVLQGVDENVLISDFFEKHQEIALTVVPDDSVDEGEPVSASRTILNTLPTQPEVAIVPEEPIPSIDDMQCALVTASVDTDGDTIQYRVEWTVDGAEYTGATTTAIPGDTVPASAYADDEVWTCRMVPYDDDGDGIAAEFEVIPETWSGPRTFTPCGSTGARGPKQTDCDGGDGYVSTDLDGEVTVTDGLQEWEVPVTGTYRITARGAAGKAATGGRYGYDGGRGAIIRGDIDLTRGDILVIAVGQVGGADFSNGGGGGGSWVMRDDDTPLVIAGGGGGLSYYGDWYGRRNGCDATTSTYGVRGSGSSYYGGCSLKTYDLGQGGDWTGYYHGNGGGGLNSDGGSERYSWLGSGGKSWANGVDGGTGGAAGGFGGGGSGSGSYGSGGGGGYSGGDSGRGRAGGAGSYNAGRNQSNTVGNTDEGEVVIDFVGF